MDNIFFQVSVLLGIIVSIAAVVRLLKQPLLVAYIIAGIIAGPLFLGLLHGDEALFHAFSEFGIVLLLFVVGLSLNMEHIKRMGKTSLIIGFSQIFGTAMLSYAILFFLPISFFSALYLSIAITFSSTVVIVKLLGEKKDNATVYGRNVFGLMVVQDIIALIFMIILDQFGASGEALQIINTFVVKIILVIAMVFFSAKYILPLILDKVAKSSEFLFIFTIAWCFGMASFLYWLGFSLEAGAIIAGLSLGSSPYQTEISSRVRPLRDFFIVIFFVILGSEMGVANINEIILPAGILILFVLFIKPIVLYKLFRMFKYTRRNAFLAGTTAAQVSEFGFILLFVGERLGQIGQFELQVFTMVALTTIIISSYLIIYNEQIYKFLIPVFNFFGKDRYRQKEEVLEKYDAFVFGYHRIGWKVCEALAEKGMKYAVVDFDPNAINKLKRRGIPAYFGDAADVEFLSALPLERARIIIMTLPEVDDQITLIQHVKGLNKKTHIIANLYHEECLGELYAAGADYVMMPHLLGGNWMSGIIREEPLTKRTMKILKRLQKEEMKLRFTAESH
jgi:Kef-type K+ transport system membrane component KefB